MGVEVRVLVFLLMDLARLPSVSDRLNEMTPDLTALAPLYLLYVPRHNAFYTLVIQFNVDKEKEREPFLFFLQSGLTSTLFTPPLIFFSFASTPRFF